MTDDARVVRTADDVSDAILKDAEAVWDGWFADEARIEWQEFIDRLSDEYGLMSSPPYEILDYDNPAVRKIQRHIRALAREV